MHDDDDVPERVPFARFLQQQRQGELADELAEQLQEVVNGVLREAQKGRNKVGELTLKIKVSPTKDMGRTVFVTDDVVAKVPLPERGGSMMFPDAKGNLHREDPAQLKLEPLKAVPQTGTVHHVDDDGNVHDVDTSTGEVRNIGGSNA